MTDDTLEPRDEYDGLSELDELTEAESELDEPADDDTAPAAADDIADGEPADEAASASEADSPAEGVIDEEAELAHAVDDDIHELAAERDQFKDIALRLQADFDNYRKRMAAQTAAEVDRATGRLAEALLPVLDAAEAAYVQHPDEVGPLLNLMLAELRKHGLESIDLLDKPFDPNLADAVAHEPGDGGEPVVAEVLRSGYSWNGRTLRPAMVRTRD